MQEHYLEITTTLFTIYGVLIILTGLYLKKLTDDIEYRKMRVNSEFDRMGRALSTQQSQINNLELEIKKFNRVISNPKKKKLDTFEKKLDLIAVKLNETDKRISMWTET